MPSCQYLTKKYQKQRFLNVCKKLTGHYWPKAFIERGVDFFCYWWCQL